MNVSRVLILLGVAACLSLIAPRPQVNAGGITSAGDTYAAIAYSSKTGRCGYSYGHTSLRDAQTNALKNCATSDARVVTWVKNGFCALAVGDKNVYGTGWASGDQASSTGVEQRALADCAKRTANGRLIASVGSTGPVAK